MNAQDKSTMPSVPGIAVRTGVKSGGMEPFVGEIALFPWNWAPQDWQLCEGQVLPIAQNPALYSLIGTTFGGNGQTTFALPNLKGKEPVPGMRYFMATGGDYPSRA